MKITTELTTLDPTLLSPTLPGKSRQIQTPKHLQNYNQGCSVEVWDEIMIILDRNRELS